MTVCDDVIVELGVCSAEWLCVELGDDEVLGDCVSLLLWVLLLVGDCDAVEAAERDCVRDAL